MEGGGAAVVDKVDLFEKYVAQFDKAAEWFTLALVFAWAEEVDPLEAIFIACRVKQERNSGS